MPSTYSSLKIQLMATGENNTTWGDVTNLNLGTAIEEAIVGSADVAFSNANVTLTLTDTNASQTARNMRLNLTGTATAGYNLVVPAIEKPYIINNGTDGTITVKNATGTGIAVPAGRTMWVYNDGTNVVDAVTRLSSLTLGSPLTVGSGGTGTATQFTAGSVVFAGASGVYSQSNANLFWDNSNNRLGIGTSSPGTRLHVQDTETTVRLTATSGRIWDLVSGGGGNVGANFFAIRDTSSGANVVQIAPQASEAMRIDSSGNVGVGTSNPVAKLAVSNAGAAGFEINPTGGVGGGATIATYNRGTAAYTSLTTYSSTMTWYAGGSTRAMDLDSSGNLGLGVTPSAGSVHIDVSNGASLYGLGTGAQIAGNAAFSSGNWVYRGTGKAARIDLNNGDSGGMLFSVASSSGTAGTAITFTQAMTLDASGNLLVGTTTSTGKKLTLAGSADMTMINTANTSGFDIGLLGGSSDATAYIYQRAASAMAFGTSNSTRMLLDASGNLGIGTSSPAAKLDVTGPDNGGGAGVLVYSANRTANLQIAFNNITTTANSGALTLAAGGATPLIFNTNGSERFRINSTGGITSSDLADAVGYKGVPQNQQTSGYTLALSDMGKHVFATAASFTITIPPNSSVAFPVGSAITIFCGDATKTLAPGSGVTLIQAGTSNTGSRTLAINALVTLVKLQTNTWVVSGAGLS